MEATLVHDLLNDFLSLYNLKMELYSSPAYKYKLI